MRVAYISRIPDRTRSMAVARFMVLMEGAWERTEKEVWAEDAIRAGVVRMEHRGPWVVAVALALLLRWPRGWFILAAASGTTVSHASGRAPLVPVLSRAWTDLRTVAMVVRFRGIFWARLMRATGHLPVGWVLLLLFMMAVRDLLMAAVCGRDSVPRRYAPVTAGVSIPVECWAPAWGTLYFARAGSDGNLNAHDHDIGPASAKRDRVQRGDPSAANAWTSEPSDDVTEILYSLIQTLPQHPDPRSVLVDCIRDLVPCRVARLELGSDRTLRIAEAWGWHSIPEWVDMSPTGIVERVIQSAQIVSGRVDAEEGGPLAEWLRREGSVHLLAVPVGGSSSDVLLLGRGLDAPFTDQDLNRIRIAVALASANRLSGTTQWRSFVPALDVLMEQSGRIVWIIDAEGCLHAVNSAARRLFTRLGIRGPVEGRSLSMLCFAGDPLPEVGTVLAEGPLGHVNLSMRTFALRDPLGALLGFVVLARDRQSGRERAAEVRRRAQLTVLGNLAASAAHEIRNPLTAINGFVQLLQSQTRDDVQRRYLDIIRQEVERLENITSDMLLLARPMRELDGRCDFAAVAESVVELMRNKAGERGVELVLEGGGSFPLVVGDRDRVEQVLLNIVRNAIESMSEPGSVRVRIESVDEGFVSVRVRDQGPGIPVEIQSRIFDAFFTTKVGGTGLGLSVGESIVRGYGGDITVHSSDKGAEFTVRLPVLKAAHTIGPAVLSSLPQ